MKGLVVLCLFIFGAALCSVDSNLQTQTTGVQAGYLHQTTVPGQIGYVSYPVRYPDGTIHNFIAERYKSDCESAERYGKELRKEELEMHKRLVDRGDIIEITPAQWEAMREDEKASYADRVNHYDRPADMRPAVGPKYIYVNAH